MVARPLPFRSRPRTGRLPDYLVHARVLNCNMGNQAYILGIQEDVKCYEVCFSQTPMMYRQKLPSWLADGGIRPLQANSAVRTDLCWVHVQAGRYNVISRFAGPNHPWLEITPSTSGTQSSHVHAHTHRGALIAETDGSILGKNCFAALKPYLSRTAEEERVRVVASEFDWSGSRRFVPHQKSVARLGLALR